MNSRCLTLLLVTRALTETFVGEEMLLFAVT